MLNKPGKCGGTLGEKKTERELPALESTSTGKTRVSGGAGETTRKGTQEVIDSGLRLGYAKGEPTQGKKKKRGDMKLPDVTLVL